MSDLIKIPELLNSKDCPAKKSQKLKTRIATLGNELTIRRALPQRDRKTIGAWCFLDHFGPLNLTKAKGLNVGPHPHLGLQTFTYTLAGEILHRDSLGSKQIIQPGQINLMTAGSGISHSEESLPDSVLHGVQLWIALPESARHNEPDFIHYPTIPIIHLNGLNIHLLAGNFLNNTSPVKVYSPLIGIELHALENTSYTLSLNQKFEHGILPLIGNVEINNQIIGIDALLYLANGQKEVGIKINKGARILIIGGEPFPEDILIWWNFVARTKQEIIAATVAWNNHTQFGEVKGYQGESLTAPNTLT